MLDNFWKLSTKFLKNLAPSDGRALPQPVAFPVTVRCFGREEEILYGPGPTPPQKATRGNTGPEVTRKRAHGKRRGALYRQKE